MEQKDYRNSHAADGYGASYDVTFKDNPYRSYIWDVEKELINDIIQEYFNGEIGSYLDFACGTGRIISHIEGNAKESTGVDISESMLEIARKNCKKSTLIQADLTGDNVLSDRKFNLISSFRFFLNAQNELRYQVMGELSKLIKDDGYLLFNIHNNTSSITNRISRTYVKLRGGKIGWNEMSISEVEKMLDTYGLKIEKKIGYATYPNFHEEKAFPRKLVGSIDKLFRNVIIAPSLSTYILYLCRKK